MSGKQFTDTNVLIYAHNLDAGFKRERAASILHAWNINTSQR